MAYVMYVFFFKQKTAYEMRISDWSSDVCSSDLVQTIKGDIGGHEVKGYLLTDSATKQVLMIDTGYNAKQMLATIAQRELTLIGVCLTHGHEIGRASCRERVCQYV